MTAVHYLQWHRRDPYWNTDSSDLFHRFHYDPPDTLTYDEFDALYEYVAEVATDDLEEVYAGWNRGSGRESTAFLECRYCERCQSYVEGIEEGVTHTVQNHGYNSFTDSSEPDYIRGARSMSVGDITELDGTYYACSPIGWQEIDLVSTDGGQVTPRERYVEYLNSLADTDDLQTHMSYQEWLEEELTEMWDKHGSPYL